MKFSALKKFLTNNNCFSSDHPEYRRVYLFNVITLLFIAVTVCSAVLCAIAGFYIQSAVHGTGAVLCVIVMIVFRRTKSLKACSYALIALMTCILAVVFYACGHAHYIFAWVSVFPPMVFFLLGRKKALITSAAFLSCMLVYMLLSYKNWAPGIFSPISIINIFSSTVALILLINYFETSRREAVESVFNKNRELEEANLALHESRERLCLILDSTAEAIFGIDLECRCTFCNTSCLELLGLDDKNELLGTDMHELLHHSKRDGTPLPRQACHIIRTCIKGAASHAEDEVFWRVNGTSFDVEYNSYPQYKDGELVGAVVTFKDNTIKRMQEQQIEYFSSHDTLTGLFNRNHFEHLVKKADIKSNLPISVIMGDLNGLKLMNDVFGHAAGDELLVRAAEAIKKVCREDELIARLGGDEFVILLPKTQEQEAQQIMARLKDFLNKEQANVIKCCMSLGCATKTTTSEHIDITLKDAENEMYKEKALNRSKTDTDMINAIIMTLYSKSPPEEQHAANVSEMCRAVGEALKLPKTECKLLRSAGFLHDIGKVSISDAILRKRSEFTHREEIEFRQHPVVGYRILNIFDSTVNLAEGVYCHHEHWDGTGYPRGLTGDEIPLMARIIAVAGRYETILNRRPGRVNHKEALELIKKDAGSILDPALVDVFITVMTDELKEVNEA